MRDGRNIHLDHVELPLHIELRKAAAQTETRVVYENIDVHLSCTKILCNALRRSRFGQVRCKDQGLHPKRRAQLLRQLFELVRTARDKRNRVAVLRKDFRQLPSDSRRSPVITAVCAVIRHPESRWRFAPRKIKLCPMQASEFFLTASDGARIFVRGWLPQQAPRAAIQVVHGLAEHSARYRELAGALTAAGFAVFAFDLRGHGPTARDADLGFFAAHGGWQSCVSDVWEVNRAIASELPDVPIGLFAHSMGSFLAQQFIAEHGDTVFGVVLSASNGRPPAIAALGRLIARMERLRLGPRGKSPLLQRLLFGEFNKRFAPARTPFDWLSRDSAEVDAYVADPLCGFEFTVQLAVDLLDALGPLLSPSNVARIPRRLPILVLSGTQDPVGSNLQNLIETYRAAGLKLTTRLYEGARHETLHETNRSEVMSDIAAWFGSNLALRASG